MTTDLVLPPTDLTEATRNSILNLKDQLGNFERGELYATIIWAQAVAAAGKARRAWELAREASDLLIRAQRELGKTLLADSPPSDEIFKLSQDWKSGGRRTAVPADLALEIKRRRNNGETLQSIADDLNNRGIPTPQEGQMWYPNTIKIIAERQSMNLDPKEEGAYRGIALMPQEMFNSVVEDLLSRGKSVDPRTVLRVGRLQSLELVEHGIHRSWDGIFFTQTSGRSTYGGFRRSKKLTIEEVREEVYEEERLTKKKPLSGPSKLIDAAFAEARRDAQALSQLRESDQFYPDVRDLIGEAELLQAKVASILYEAYREFQVQQKKHRPFRMPQK